MTAILCRLMQMNLIVNLIVRLEKKDVEDMEFIFKLWRIVKMKLEIRI